MLHVCGQQGHGKFKVLLVRFTAWAHWPPGHTRRAGASPARRRAGCRAGPSCHGPRSTRPSTPSDLCDAKLVAMVSRAFVNTGLTSPVKSRRRPTYVQPDGPQSPQRRGPRPRGRPGQGRSGLGSPAKSWHARLPRRRWTRAAVSPSEQHVPSVHFSGMAATAPEILSV